MFYVESKKDVVKLGWTEVLLAENLWRATAIFLMIDTDSAVDSWMDYKYIMWHLPFQYTSYLARIKSYHT